MLGVGLAWLHVVGSTLAATPAPSQPAAGDPRAGQAPGFIGDPALAIAVVVAIAVVSVVATLAWIRATGGPRRTDDQG